MTFDNPEARAKQIELTSDRPGRSVDSHVERRHAMEVEVGPKEQEQSGPRDSCRRQGGASLLLLRVFAGPAITIQPGGMTGCE
jgi:hypothetical protein